MFLNSCINDILKNNINTKIYLATDDNNIKTKFLHLYKDNIIVYENETKLLFLNDCNIYSGNNKLCNNANMIRKDKYIIESLIELYLLSNTILTLFENCE